MKVAGIIAEYNPFHKGHQYHIEETRKQTGADYVIAVMSGDYVQRGEPAIADKYMRTRMALSGGADLVIEMPVIYATASAEYFATAGIGILDRLGCVDYLSFGSEWADVEDYSSYATLFLEEPEEYRQILQEQLKRGKSFPEARAFTAGKLLFDSKPETAVEFLKEPNHILGLEYIKALRRRNSSIQPITVKRKGNHYHEKILAEDNISARRFDLDMPYMFRCRNCSECGWLQHAVDVCSGSCRRNYRQFPAYDLSPRPEQPRPDISGQSCFFDRRAKEQKIRFGSDSYKI